MASLPPKYTGKLGKMITEAQFIADCGPHVTTALQWVTDNHPGFVWPISESWIDAALDAVIQPAGSSTVATGLVSQRDIARAAGVHVKTVREWLAVHSDICPDAMGGDTGKLKLYAPIVQQWFLDRKNKSANTNKGE